MTETPKIFNDKLTAIALQAILVLSVVSGAGVASAGTASLADSAGNSTGGISGSVYDEDTTEPLVNATVTVEDWSGDVVAQTTTDSVGEYNVSDIEPGNYTVVAEFRGDTGQSQALVEAGETVEADIAVPVEGDEPETGSIVGAVTDETGEPLADATVSVENDAGETVVRTTPDLDGDYGVGGLEPGNYTIVAEFDGATGQTAVYVEAGSRVDGGVVVPTDEEAPATGNVSGSVLDEDTTEPLANATVTVEDATGAVVAQTTTDSDGEYSVGGLESGNYTVVAEFGGDTEKTRVTVEAGRTTEVDLIVSVDRTGTIRGTVTDETVKPLANATVSVENDVGETIARTTTDSDGEYSVSGLEPGDYTLVAEFRSDTGYADVVVEAGATAEGDVVVPVEENEPETGNVSGSVLDADTTEPLANATVTVEDATGAVVAQTTTDSDGDYSVGGLEPGNYTLVAEFGSGTERTRVTVEAGRTTDVDLVVSVDMTGSIVGAVTDETGEPLADATVTIENDAGETVVRTTTDPGGDYGVGGLEPGKYTVIAEYDGAAGQAAVYVEAGSRADGGVVVPTDEEAPTTGNVSGGVFDADTTEPLVNATVTVENDVGETIARTTTDSDGEYSVGGLEPGNYTVVAEFGGDTGYADVVVEAGATAEGDVVIPVEENEPETGNVTGRVTNTTLEPLVNATVTIENASGEVVAQTTAGPNGSYEVTGLAPGDYTLVAEYGGETGYGDATVRAGLTVQGSIVVVVDAEDEEDETGALAGVVSDESDEPLANATVTVENESGEVVAQTTVGTNGSYDVTGLAASNYTVVAEVGNDTGQTEATVEAGETTDADVVVSTDDEDEEESPLDGVAAEYDQDGDGQISDEEFRRAVVDWAVGEIDDEELRAVLIAWSSS